MPFQFNKKNILFIAISILLGITYLFSAFAKTVPLTPFIDTIYQKFGLIYQVASILGKSIIGLEAGIGILLLLGLYGKRKWVLYLSILMLIAFTAYIIMLWITEGADADCGCMGDFVQLNPLESIIKNVIMICLTFLLFKDKREESKSKNIFALIIPILFIFYPFIFVPGEMDIKSMSYTDSSNVTHNPPINLNEGKHIVAFLSTSCKHCINAAINFGEMKRDDPEFPILFIFPESALEPNSLLDTFIEKTETHNVDRYFLPMETFKELAGRGVPSIFMLDGAEIKDKIDNYKNIQLKELQNWYSEKK